MKLTKQRLKEIIKEELTTVHEAPGSDGIDLPTWEDGPFGDYDLEAENEKEKLATIAAAFIKTGLDPNDASLWEKILDAVRKANIFPRTEQ